MHGLWSGISRIFTPLSKEFYVRSAHSRAALTPQNVHWTFFGAAVSLSRSEAVSWESQSLRIKKNNILGALMIFFFQILAYVKKKQ